MQLGLFVLPWWGYALVTLGLTHVAIAAVTIFPHRSQAHRAVDQHPIVTHRYDVMTRFVRSVRDDSAAEIAKLKAGANLSNSWSLDSFRRWLSKEPADRAGLDTLPGKSKRLRSHAQELAGGSLVRL
ncbi:MAG: hypothetical protein QG662_29 [Pseudomonadota bacterium]|nr:hypothetical protein [Pseudomonadota bacterium]